MSEQDPTLLVSTIDQLAGFVDSEVQRMQATLSFLEEALPIAEDLETCNHRLQSAGRDDLVISSRAVMIDVDSPLGVFEKCNNFIPNFEIITGIREIERKSSFGFDHTDRKPIPITEDELDTLISEDGQPFIETDRLLDPRYNSHANKAAFIRMFLLFPDFTKKLVLDFSKDRYGAVYKRYAAELFAAYQIMSRLVDESDKYVLRDGQVDDWYLCR